MNKTTITFWRGLRTIGGNIAEICYGNDRVIFDFGLVFDPAGSLLGDTSGRKEKKVHDLLRLGMIPAIDGIYQKETLTHAISQDTLPKPVEESTVNTAVFISHLHLDHMGALKTIAPEVPVHMSEDATHLYHSMVTIGEEAMNEREVIPISYEVPKQVGEITVTPYHVDHDTHGAVSLLVETPDLKVVYSGDLRMHGTHPEWNTHWVKEMKHQQVDLLLMEGTTFRPEDVQVDGKVACPSSEKDVAKVVAEKLEAANGVAIFNFYHRNIERIENMIHASSLADRRTVLEPETAYVAKQFLPDASFCVLDNGRKDAFTWQTEIKQTYETVTLNDINENPKAYYLQNSFHHLMDLLDLNLENSVYIHANGMPLGDFDPNYQKLLTFLGRFSVDYQSLDISGHAFKKDILHIIDEIKPKVLVPWHSHYPDLVKPIKKSQAVFFPELEGKYVFDGTTLVPSI